MTNVLDIIIAGEDRAANDERQRAAKHKATLVTSQRAYICPKTRDKIWETLYHDGHIDREVFGNAGPAN